MGARFWREVDHLASTNVASRHGSESECPQASKALQKESLRAS